MKAIAINSSPRKGWNTDMLLQQALKGATDADFVTLGEEDCRNI